MPSFHAHTAHAAPRSPPSSRRFLAPEEGPRERTASARRQRRSPSQGAAPSQLRNTQAFDCSDAIYNERPLDPVSDVPITVYHPAFSTLLRVWNGDEALERQEIASARRLVRPCAGLYESKADRIDALDKGGIDEAVHDSIVAEFSWRLSSTKTIKRPSQMDL
ncbi:hypothetical protein BV20DRAFT_481129 [Pilatotrama ljubarskyi]|nr:hypothetical protein BV20DRAFT_481129 [Pilatotrama ljubarskyi]